MKVRTFKVLQGTKFNDPKENYRNHSVATELVCELEEGEDLDGALDEANRMAREKLDRQRSQVIERVKMQAKFEELVKDAEYKKRDYERYERDTKEGRKRRQELEAIGGRLAQMAAELGAQGVFVKAPQLALPQLADLSAEDGADDDDEED